MIFPSTVYGREVTDRPFVPANGDECFRAIINSYYGAEAESARRVEALLQYTWFRQGNPGSAGSPSFWRSPEARIAGRGLEDDAPDRFWTLASSYAPALAEVARKFCNGYAGQGSSERCNKDMANMRTKARNRQSGVARSSQSSPTTGSTMRGSGYSHSIRRFKRS
ncbi:hypothetical protein B484DRAFT_448294 [Ochromonadaceae sp. CCMP2298]|nr:hypothetical protein B484DRAFT_448294 [Ochromonadaceae sp. CCMP2298]